MKTWQEYDDNYADDSYLDDSYLDDSKESRINKFNQSFANFLKGEARRKREIAAEGVWPEKLTDAGLYEAEQIDTVLIPAFEQFSKEFNEWYQEHEQEMLKVILQQKEIIKNFEKTIEELR